MQKAQKRKVQEKKKIKVQREGFCMEYPSSKT